MADETFLAKDSLAGASLAEASLPGLSICLPVYGWPVLHLVQNLVAQVQNLDLAWEIRVLDDGSPLPLRQPNQDLHTLPQVHYYEQPVNAGRAATRNRLAEAAQYEWLLFLDSDVSVVSEDFLARYWAVALGKEEQVLSGGLVYAAARPAQAAQRLRWAYGQQNEVRSAAQRQQDPWRSFTTANFLVLRSVLLAHPFEEQLTDYGHEDTLWGMTLEAAGCSIRHIDNPVQHDGLETAAVFLDKTQKGIRNLHQLVGLGIPESMLARHVRLYAWGQKAEQKGLRELLAFAYRAFGGFIRAQLQGKRPSLRLFAFYKLAYLCASWPEDPSSAQDER